MIALLLFVLGFGGADLLAQTTNLFWQKQSIYQIITDRFYDGNTNNDNAEGTYAPSNPRGVHGGDFAGIEQKLDYIKALGATAIWISPIVLNTEGQFHGYSAWNFYKVAPHWGSITDLQHLVQAAHARGLLVIDDIVVNHAGDLVQSSGSTFNYPTGYTLSYRNTNKTYPAPFNLSAANPSLTNLFHNYGNIQNFNDSTQVVLGWLDGLNDFRTETPYVRTNMAAIYEYWIKQIGFDGFRVDTALEVDTGCWQYFCPAIHAYAAANGDSNFFMFAEANSANESVVGSYTGTEAGGPFEFDSVLDYPLYDNVIQGVFARAVSPTFLIQRHYDNVDRFYDAVSRMQLVTFLDNHDNPRFLSTSEANGNTNRLKVALAFLYTSPGIPCLYYGTEQGFDGTTDPNDREDMFAGEFKDGPNGTVMQLNSPGADNFDMTHPLFLWIARLNNFRRLYPALTLGSYTNRANDSIGPGFFAYSRILNTQEVFVAFNTAATNVTLPPRPLTYPAGTVLVNLLNTNETITVGSNSETPVLNLPASSVKMFLAQSQWLPLDPVVESNFPAHDANNVPINAPIVLHFSKPMDTNRVQAAFSTTPAIAGTFAWSAAHDTMTFTPGGGGLPPLTTVFVNVTNSAVDAVSGNAMFAAYQTEFHTGPALLLSNPATNDTIVTLTSSNLVYLIQACFGTSLASATTNFEIYINGVLQPQSSYFVRPVGAVSGCPGMNSLFYYWNITAAGTYNIQVTYRNSVGYSDSKSVIVPPPQLSLSSPATNDTIVTLTSSNVVYLIQACFSPSMVSATTNFEIYLNGVLQPQSTYFIRPAGSVSGCPGMDSLFYNWSITNVGTYTIQVTYRNSVVVSDSKTVIVAPLFQITGLSHVGPSGGHPLVVWGSTPAVKYQVLMTTNLARPFEPIGPLITTNGFSASLYDTSPPAPQKFYVIDTVR